ncbi:MAG: sigma 54-interacting transcriptional regulator [Desulfotalea sp.]
MKKTNKIPDNVTETILESISDGVFTVDNNWRITSFNKAASDITGANKEEAIGKFCWDVFQSNMCKKDCSLKRSMKEGRSFINSYTSIKNKNRGYISVTVSTSPLIDEKGELLGGVETFRDHSYVEELRKELEGNFQFENMVSRSKKMKNLFDILEQVATSDSTVLVEGETGTGKELMAKAIHNLSNRAGEAFIAINCGALPDNLLESELFGYKAGAFTDAKKDKEGLFAAASGGTILLDEIGDTSPAFQVRLLRVLEEKEFLPLGATRKVATDCRIIAATHQGLRKQVEEKTFRQDLFYRINIINLNLPPLRERNEDIALLVEKFIKKFNLIKGKDIGQLSPESMQTLLKHDFPGNIRELENIIEHAFVLCTDTTIQNKHLPIYLSENIVELKPEATKIDLIITEKEQILDALAQNSYNRQATADFLGIHKSTLFRKIKKLDITLPTQDGRNSRR